MTVHAGAPFTDFILTSDPDGGVLSLTAPTLPDWLALSARPDGTGTLSGTPPASAVGAHPVTLRVTDLTGRSSFRSWMLRRRRPRPRAAAAVVVSVQDCARPIRAFRFSRCWWPRCGCGVPARAPSLELQRARHPVFELDLRFG
ncbi:MAG TPA: Ig domain-containing protein [Polyangiaceae bacterium]|nr:Ig domain-containing protein [Polyangiaceae bacterium]